MKISKVSMFLVFMVLSAIVVGYSSLPEPAVAQSQNYAHFPQLTPKPKPQPPDPIQQLQKKLADSTKTVQELSLQVAETHVALEHAQKQLAEVQEHIAVCKCGHQDKGNCWSVARQPSLRDRLRIGNHPIRKMILWDSSSGCHFQKGQ